jgi:hypothetical protein
MKTPICFWLATAIALLGGCQVAPDDEDTAIAAEELTMPLDPTAVIDAVVGGAGYDEDSQCLIIGPAVKCPVVADDEWQFADSPSGLRIRPRVYELLQGSSLFVDPDNGAMLVATSVGPQQLAPVNGYCHFIDP